MKINMNVGIILAAGRGKRLNSTARNKTALSFSGKPLVRYGVDLFLLTCDLVVVVTGYAGKSVRSVVPKKKKVIFASQRRLLGTGHAVRQALKALREKSISPKTVLVGYGDHLMFYSPEVINDLVSLQKKRKSEIVLVSTRVKNPDVSAWGRVIRDDNGSVKKIVEQKDASEDERAVTEVNAGLYCFDFKFLKNFIDKIERSSVSGEYYLTDLIGIARDNGLRVSALVVPFEGVGIGVNTKKDLAESQKMYESVTSK